MNEFPMKIKFGSVDLNTDYYDSEYNILLTLIDWPRQGFRERCVEMMKATWADKPFEADKLSEHELSLEFMKILKFKVLPNSLEHINFQFRVDGLTLIEVTHLLRHRQLHAIHAQCSADRFLHDDSVFIPSSINNSRFAERYKELTEDCKKLYADMVDSKEVSILDARYILTRNHRYFYYFGCDLKTAIQFIHQRKCTAIQPELDNVMAHQMLELITHTIPELRHVVSLKCDKRCVFVNSDSIDSSRVYYPDSNHRETISKIHGDGSERLSSNYYLYTKTRHQMGVKYGNEDKL